MIEERESLQPPGCAIIIQFQCNESTQRLESVKSELLGSGDAVIFTDQELVFTTTQYLSQCFSLIKSTGEDIEIVAIINSHNGALIIIPGSGEQFATVNTYGIFTLQALNNNTSTNYIIIYAKDHEEAMSFYNHVYVQNQQIH